MSRTRTMGSFVRVSGYFAAFALSGVVAFPGCSAGRPKDRGGTPPRAPADPVSEPADTTDDPGDTDAPDPHRVVFADRTSHAYLLILPPSAAPQGIDRAKVLSLVEDHFEEWRDDPEVALLFEMVRTDPATLREDPTKLGASNDELAWAAEANTKDVLGLHVEVLSLRDSGQPPLVPAEVLTDPVLARAVPPDARRRLTRADHALLLRAEYRNAHAVRGLRLLQAVTDVVATALDAAIFDFDTKETVLPETFRGRLFRRDLYNVADQIAVVPLPDRTTPGGVRLSTRGMRRFGSPDLELRGLTADPAHLQAATHLLMGLAYRVAHEAEIDASGFARASEEEIEVTYRDVDGAYASRGAHLPHCDGCPERTVVHLVRRPPEPSDPRGHPVALVVAPRDESDAPGYDQAAWVRRALSELLGDPGRDGTAPSAAKP